MTTDEFFSTIQGRVSNRVDAVRLACELEAHAPKLGNVHPTARFNDCEYHDFVVAASEIAPILGSDDWSLSLGDRVLRAVECTRMVTAANVNLGIILLIAPLAMADDLKMLGNILMSITPQDGRKVFEAIRLASPGGMKRDDIADEHDVQSTHWQPIDLIAAMKQAADRDRIALQYASDFTDFFKNVVPIVREEVSRPIPVSAAIVLAQLRLMAHDIDSLIARKCGIEIAAEARRRAADCLASDSAQSRAAFDAWLRADGNCRNPGTTADLIAAALFWLLRELREPNA